MQQSMRQLASLDGARIDEIERVASIEDLPDEVRFETLTHLVIHRGSRRAHVGKRIFRRQINRNGGIRLALAQHRADSLQIARHRRHDGVPGIVIS